MTGCERIRALLAALPDGELGAAARDSVESHLERCTVCRAEAEALVGVSRLLAASPCSERVGRLPTGAQFVVSVRREERERRRFWRPPGVRRVLPEFIALGATVTVILGLAGNILRTTEPDHRLGPAPLEQPQALVVIDDATAGRQVLLAPSAGGSLGVVQ